MIGRIWWSDVHLSLVPVMLVKITLTDGIFETGANGVPSKSQNPTVLGQGGLSSTQCSNPTWACSWHHPFGTNNYPPFQHSTQNQVYFLTLDC